MGKTKAPKQPGQRKLKVYYKYLSRSYGTVQLPEIRLCGYWLKECGFEIGKDITIKTEANKLVISLP